MYEHELLDGTDLRRVAALCLLLVAGNSGAAGLQDWIQSFAQSDFRFNRSNSNAPFPALAWATVAGYGSTAFSVPGGSSAAPVSYTQHTLSQGAVVPFLATRRDALVAGEWLSVSHFNTDSAAIGDFDAYSLSVPLGWMRQQTDSWQLAAFAAPMGHESSGSNSPWLWEYMGGAFGRYARSDTLSWIFGFYADLASGQNLYIPYIGANWIISPKWTLNAIMPWPGILYAPTQDMFFRLGVSPSGASWALRPNTRELTLNLDAWNFGLSVEHRIRGRLWARGEAGISGLRGFSYSGSQWNDMNSNLGTTPYVSIGISFRPSMH